MFKVLTLIVGKLCHIVEVNWKTFQNSSGKCKWTKILCHISIIYIFIVYQLCYEKRMDIIVDINIFLCVGWVYGDIKIKILWFKWRLAVQCKTIYSLSFKSWVRETLLSFQIVFYFWWKGKFFCEKQKIHNRLSWQNYC